MGGRFFKILGTFSYLVAAVALVIAIALGITAATKFLHTVDENVAQPEATLEEYIRSNQRQQDSDGADSKPLDGESTDDERDEADRNYQTALGPLIDRIFTSLDSYGTVTQQGTVNREGLEEYLIGNTEDLNREEYLLFLAALAAETEKLAARTGSEVEWSEFVSWFTNSYMEQYRDELSRIQNERAEQAAGRVEFLTTATSAVGAFFVFVFFTVILLLVQIEQNTRARSKRVSGLERA